MALLNTSAPKSQATQDFVPIKEIRDNIVILKDGSLRAIVLASAVNFALKSTDEQASIILQFQNFLNSLNFSIQISIQSRKLDIRPYLAILEEREKAQTIELMKIQTREYIEFVKNFTETTNIMTKSFFVVIPYTPAIIASKRGNGEENFQENASQLAQRVEVVEGGLTRCGIRIVELGTEELIELYYKSFNPGVLEKPIHIAK
jgi:type IV secretory pathway VirB4 component